MKRRFIVPAFFVVEVDGNHGTVERSVQDMIREVEDICMEPQRKANESFPDGVGALLVDELPTMEVDADGLYPYTMWDALRNKLVEA